MKIKCRELLALEHPDCIRAFFAGGCACCPSSYRYLKDPEWCHDKAVPDNKACTKCWDREVEISEKLAKKLGITFTKNKKDEEKTMELKDSGERREFSTGAVRDIQEGKGRCDLMPLDVLDDFYTWIETSTTDFDGVHIFQYLDAFRRTGELRMLHCAIWNFIVHCKAYPDPETAFLELSKHFEDGAKKYGENNWQKGIPVNAYMDSALRHYLKWLRGDDDEPHDRAFIWNLVCCIWTMTHKPELDNFTEKGNEKNGEQSETKWETDAAPKKTNRKCSEERATR